MMGRVDQMKNKKIFMLILLCAMLLGCSKAERDQGAQREEAANKVITAMFTGPNEDLCNESAFEMIGEGIEKPEEKGEGWEELKQNWKDLVGEYFVSEVFDTFVEMGPANQFLSEAYIREETMSIEEIELSQKEEDTEVYLVHWLIGEEEREDKIFFRYDSEGLIEEVKVL